MFYTICSNPNCFFQDEFESEPQAGERNCPKCGWAVLSACPKPECKAPLKRSKQRYCEACGQMLKLGRPEPRYAKTDIDHNF